MSPKDFENQFKFALVDLNTPAVPTYGLDQEVSIIRRARFLKTPVDVGLNYKKLEAFAARDREFLVMADRVDRQTKNNFPSKN